MVWAALVRLAFMVSIPSSVLKELTICYATMFDLAKQVFHSFPHHLGCSGSGDDSLSVYSEPRKNSPECGNGFTDPETNALEHNTVLAPTHNAFCSSLNL